MFNATFQLLDVLSIHHRWILRLNIFQSFKQAFPLAIDVLIMFVQVCVSGGETNARPISEETFTVLLFHVLQVAYYLQHAILYHFIFHVLWVAAESLVGHDMLRNVKHILPHAFGYNPSPLLPLLPFIVNLFARKIIVVFRFVHCLLFLHCVCIKMFSIALGVFALLPPPANLVFSFLNILTKSSGALYSLTYT